MEITAALSLVVLTAIGLGGPQRRHLEGDPGIRKGLAERQAGYTGMRSVLS